MTKSRTAELTPEKPSFVDAALLGRNEWWRYLAALMLFLGLYVAAALSCVYGAGKLYEKYAALFPAAGGLPPFADVFNMDTGWPEASTPVAVLLFAAAMSSVIVAIPALWIALKGVHKRSISTVLGHSGFEWRLFGASFSAAAFGFGLFSVIELVIFQGHISLGDFSKLAAFIPAFLLFLPLQVLAEEMVFRGYLLQTVAWMTPRTWIRIAVPALIFAFLHYDNAEVRAEPLMAMTYFVVFSAYVTWISLRTDGIAGAVGFHLAMNIFAAFVISSSLSAYISPSLFYSSQPAAWLLPVEIFSVICIHYILFRKHLSS